VYFAAFDAPFAVRRGADEITTARERLDIAAIHVFLITSDWAAGIPRATVERALEGSPNFGVSRGDAHGLYAHAAFSPLKHPERFLEITDPDVCRRAGG